MVLVTVVDVLPGVVCQSMSSFNARGRVKLVVPPINVMETRALWGAFLR